MWRGPLAYGQATATRMRSRRPSAAIEEGNHTSGRVPRLRPRRALRVSPHVTLETRRTQMATAAKRKATTGIVRHIDELGRIVIPIEIRKRFGLNEKDPLEISVRGETILLTRPLLRCVSVAAARDSRRTGAARSAGRVSPSSAPRARG